MGRGVLLGSAARGVRSSNNCYAAHAVPRSKGGSAIPVSSSPKLELLRRAAGRATKLESQHRGVPRAPVRRIRTGRCPGRRGAPLSDSFSRGSRFPASTGAALAASSQLEAATCGAGAGLAAFSRAEAASSFGRGISGSRGRYQRVRHNTPLQSDRLDADARRFVMLSSRRLGGSGRGGGHRLQLNGRSVMRQSAEDEASQSRAVSVGERAPRFGVPLEPSAHLHLPEPSHSVRAAQVVAGRKSARRGTTRAKLLPRRR